MQTYTFENLSDRAAINAIRLYGDEVGIRAGDVKSEDAKKFEGWLFTEHGERVA